MRIRKLIAHAARVLAVTAVAALLAPAVAILGLRWIDPPSTSFMLRDALQRRFGGHREEARSGDRSAGSKSRAARAIDYRWTGLDDIAPAMALAAVAAEDQLFPVHHGFDVESIADAIEERHRRGRMRGASTISQQVAKNLFLWPGRSFARKAGEAYLTVVLELAWPKRRILEVYLNVAEMGDGIYGVGAASQRYFGKEPRALTPREAALLAAALPDPKRRRPDRPSEWMRERASWIEKQMSQLETWDHRARPARRSRSTRPALGSSRDRTPG